MPALVLNPYRRDATTVGSKGRVSRADVDREALFQEFSKRLVEHFFEKQADYSWLGFF
jgi:hypothetical protein